jgi:predicted transcriptional regulator
MTIRDTQLEAWESIQESLPESRRSVLRVIENAGDHGITTFDTAEKLGWPINQVSGRITELNQVGIVTDSGRRGVNPSGKRAILWIVNHTPFKFDHKGQGEFL